MTLDDLLGSLQIYEMNLNTQTNDKGIDLKAHVNGSDSVPYTEDEIIMLTQNFGKLFQKFGKISRSQNFIREESQDIKNRISEELKGMLKEIELKYIEKGIRCKECEEFGHIQAECANTLKKNRLLNTTVSEDERKEDTNYNEGDETKFTHTITLM